MILTKRAFFAVSLIFICLTACSPRNGADSGAPAQAKPRVAVTTDALFEITSAIGGDRVSVTKIIPDGVELHDYEPRAKDLILLKSADLVIFNGLGLEPWLGGALGAAGASAALTADASSSVVPLPVPEAPDSSDPHIWLSLTCAKIMAENIKSALTEADPGGAELYEGRCREFTAMQDALYDKYAGKFAELENRTFVTGHAVFSYLCRDFGLEQISVEGVFSEGEPSAKRLTELIAFCRENGVKAVLTERLSSSLVPDTLAREAGAEVKTVYTIESAEDGKSYLERMEHNLAVIYESLL